MEPNAFLTTASWTWSHLLSSVLSVDDMEDMAAILARTDLVVLTEHGVYYRCGLHTSGWPDLKRLVVWERTANLPRLHARSLGHLRPFIFVGFPCSWWLLLCWWEGWLYWKCFLVILIVFGKHVNARLPGQWQTTRSTFSTILRKGRSRFAMSNCSMHASRHTVGSEGGALAYILYVHVLI